MNKKEISEIKKQFTPENCSLTRICGCYVDGEKNKKTELKEAFLSLSEEEMFKYFEIFRKSLSGTIGKNLMNMEFPLEQETEGGTQHFLMKHSCHIRNRPYLHRPGLSAPRLCYHGKFARHVLSAGPCWQGHRKSGQDQIVVRPAAHMRGLNGYPGSCPQWPVRLPLYTQCLPCGKHGTDPAPHAHAHRWQNENKLALYLSIKSLQSKSCHSRQP